ncbi:MAG: DUF47 family protein [Desulfurococcaceae archaeon]|jgi:uncharacterized protein Yka (UPF0111/DUF47 family)
MIEERRESLVEMTAIEHIVNMCRIVRDEMSELNLMLKVYQEGKGGGDLGKIYEKVRNIKNKGEELVVLIMEYLIKSSEVVFYSSSFINIIRTLDRVLQQIDGVAYRVYLAHENKVLLDKDVLDTFINIIEIEKKQVQDLEDAFMKIRLSPKAVLGIISSVFETEENIDTIYRKSLFEIYARYSGYITALLILKDIFEHLEEISDFLKNVGEEVRYLAIARSAT